VQNVIKDLVYQSGKAEPGDFINRIESTQFTQHYAVLVLTQMMDYTELFTHIISLSRKTA